MYSDLQYASVIHNEVTYLSDSTGYNPKSWMSKEEADMCFQFDVHDVYLTTKGQGRDEWQPMQFGHITSTLAHNTTPDKDGN